jgi:hypothetical protein
METKNGANRTWPVQLNIAIDDDLRELITQIQARRTRTGRTLTVAEVVRIALVNEHESVYPGKDKRRRDTIRAKMNLIVDSV